jgi:hypothetical protein
METVAQMRETEFELQVPNPWWGMTHLYSLAQMIEEDAISHSTEHTRQIIEWKKTTVVT